MKKIQLKQLIKEIIEEALDRRTFLKRMAMAGTGTLVGASKAKSQDNKPENNDLKAFQEESFKVSNRWTGIVIPYFLNSSDKKSNEQEKILNRMGFFGKKPTNNDPDEPFNAAGEYNKTTINIIKKQCVEIIKNNLSSKSIIDYAEKFMDFIYKNRPMQLTLAK